MPTPPTMQNHGNYVASLCEIVRWLGEKAEGLGVNMFTGFPAGRAARRGEPRARRAHDADRPRSATASRAAGYTPPTDITAKVTVLSEGHARHARPGVAASGRRSAPTTRRSTPSGSRSSGRRRSRWTRSSTRWAGRSRRDAFGGSFCYPLEPNLVALGLVVGLDYRQTTLDVHVLLQRLKLHPLFRPYLEGGEMVEWGAKTIPEGGYYALPAAPPRRRRCSSSATPPGSSRSPRSRASTTRCSRACYAARAHLRCAQEGRHVRGRASPPTTRGGRERHREGPARAAEHAPGVPEGGLLPGRHPGRAHDA